MESDFVLPCDNSPLSVSIPQFYGKGGDDCPNCFISFIFGGVSTIGTSVPNVEICLPLLFFGKCLLHICRHKNIYNLSVESYVLFRKNLLGLQTEEAASKVKEFSTFLCMRRVTSLKSFPFICISPSGAGILYSPS